MYRELDKEKWMKSLIKAQQAKASYQVISKLTHIIKTGLESTTKNDLLVLDFFYPYLPDDEAENLRTFISERYDYVEADNGIKSARLKAGLKTQREFAEQFDIPLDVIKSWESGRRTPPAWAEKLLLEKLDSMKNEE